jgi:hypothetical protein
MAGKEDKAKRTVTLTLTGEDAERLDRLVQHMRGITSRSALARLAFQRGLATLDQLTPDLRAPAPPPPWEALEEGIGGLLGLGAGEPTPPEPEPVLGPSAGQEEATPKVAHPDDFIEPKHNPCDVPQDLQDLLDSV